MKYADRVYISWKNVGDLINNENSYKLLVKKRGEYFLFFKILVSLCISGD